MLFSELPDIHQGSIIQYPSEGEIGPLTVDSRKAIGSEKSLFFAIKGPRHDGHHYIDDLYKKGLRQFVIQRDIDYSRYPKAGFFKTKSSVEALQSLATHHRKKFSFPVVGIAGSRGKTTVKEWLYQLLSADYDCIKSPGSYNSQIGTPLSLWLMANRHQLGIFEAGISEAGEMRRQRQMIQPTIGLITNIDPTGDENDNLISENISLFEEADTIIYCHDHPSITAAVADFKKKQTDLLSWGQTEGGAVQVRFEGPKKVHLSGRFGHLSLTLPFTDTASKENMLHCLLALLHLNESPKNLQQKINALRAAPMRLEFKSGINQCQIVDDTYSNDLAGLPIGMDFLSGMSAQQKTIILPDIPYLKKNDTTPFSYIADLVKEKNIHRLIGIGEGFCANQHYFHDLPIKKQFYPTVAALMKTINWDDFYNEAILIKRAHYLEFDDIVRCLQRKTHNSVMSIDLDAITHNLNFFKSILRPPAKLMMMVKASAYGGGGNEITRILQYHQVDYFGVAQADEGITLRRNGVHAPIMVMNPTEDDFDTLLEYDLEPEIYSLPLLRALIHHLKNRPCGIHLKIDTGMHRLGLQQGDISAVKPLLTAHPNIIVKSVFSHLVGANIPTHNRFSAKQTDLLQSAFSQLKDVLPTPPPLCHILNSGGTLRFPQWHFGMVRLGIGLYGVDPTNTTQDKLRVAITLKTIVLQVTEVHKGDTVGYDRKGLIHETSLIATLSIGYADGFLRSYSEGKGQVLIHGKRAPVVGNVCMDMTMVDVTDIANVQAGDEAVIFGAQLPIQWVAEQINTIPHEVLASTGSRVERIFFAQNI